MATQTWGGHQPLQNGQLVADDIILNDITNVQVDNGTATISGSIGKKHSIRKYGTGTLILAGEYLCSDPIFVVSGELALGVVGNIENAEAIRLIYERQICCFNITAGSQSVRALISDKNCTVNLGARTLTLESGNHQGTFTGKSGQVIKTGQNTKFSMDGQQMAHSIFSIKQGELIFAGSWSGEMAKSASGVLTVMGSTVVEGQLTLVGSEMTLAGGPGFVNMNFKPIKPFVNSQISVNGRAEAKGITVINITAIGNDPGYLLINANGGLSVANFVTKGNTGGRQLTTKQNGTELWLEMTKKTVKIGSQNNRIKAGEQGTISFPISTFGIADGAYRVAFAELPMGVSVYPTVVNGDVEILNNEGKLVLECNEQTVTSVSERFLALDGVQSNIFTIKIE